MPIDERRDFQRRADEARAEAGSGAGSSDFDRDGDAGSGLADVIADAMSTSKKRRRRRKIHWKTEWLVYNLYTRCNISMGRVAALCGIGKTSVHDIVYAWANYLCLALDKLCRTPTRSQMLRAYPKNIVRKFGHANVWLLLDATEIGANVASMKTVNAIMYSPYKHGSTMKWLAACDTIGATWEAALGAGHGGSISDPVATAVSTILENIPFGMAVEVDKGFLIENACALLGIVSIRPMKLLEGQQQQSKEDTALTQKIGKSRITIEQNNGQMKQSTNFFDSKIRIQQIGLADRIFHASFLLQNFKLPFVQGRDKNAARVGRHCKLRIRWYDGSDDGLIDVRPMVDLWGLDCEIKRWHELRKQNDNLTDTEVSELVLDEDWPAKMRKLHLENLECETS